MDAAKMDILQRTAFSKERNLLLGPGGAKEISNTLNNFALDKKIIVGDCWETSSGAQVSTAQRHKCSSRPCPPSLKERWRRTTSPHRASSTLPPGARQVPSQLKLPITPHIPFPLDSLGLKISPRNC